MKYLKNNKPGRTNRTGSDRTPVNDLSALENEDVFCLFRGFFFVNTLFAGKNKGHTPVKHWVKLQVNSDNESQ